MRFDEWIERIQALVSEWSLGLMSESKEFEGSIGIKGLIRGLMGFEGDERIRGLMRESGF